MKHLIIKYPSEGKAIAARQRMKALAPAISMSCYLSREGSSLAFTATDTSEVAEIEALCKETDGEITYNEEVK
jgi:hypothetical protein